MIEIIFFDFDGVIVESVDIKTAAFARLFEGEGETIVKKVVAYHLDNGGVSRYDKFRHIYRRILARPLREKEFKKLCDDFAGLVADNVAAAPYVKGAMEFLKTFAPKYRFFVLSATPQEEIEKIVERKGITHLFRGVYGAPNKKADAVKEILSREKVRPADSLYVGDAMSDYAAARENGVRFIARVRRDDPVFNDTDCLKIEDLARLESLIEGL